MENISKSKIIDISNEIPIKKNHTISKTLFRGSDCLFSLFSLGVNTNISPEYYEHISIFIVLKGSIKVQNHILKKGDLLITNPNKIRGIISNLDSIYLDLSLIKGGNIMDNIEKGKVIELKNAIEYVDGGISNLDIVSKDNVKIILMSFDKGEGLTPHSAPGDALLIALEGNAEILIGEETFIISEGQQIILPKNIIHNVFANTTFKMALILVKD